jgi:hypothetical protein
MPFDDETEMLSFRTEILELCRAFDDHTMAGHALDERDARAAQALRAFQTRVIPDLLARRLIVSRDGALWEWDARRGGYWVNVSRQLFVESEIGYSSQTD